MTAQSLAVRDFRFALVELGDVDVVEDGEAGHFRGWIGGDCFRDGEPHEKKEREEAHDFLDVGKAPCFTRFFHLKKPHLSHSAAVATIGAGAPSRRRGAAMPTSNGP